MNYLDFILSQGYRVFTRPNTEYCYYTDGTNIGYAQWSRNTTKVASLHKPSRQVGTGYGVADTITEQTLQAALTLHCPHWDAHNADNVKKYKDWDEFHNKNDWNKALVEYKGEPEPCE